jgi:hypothetical protein
MRCDGNWTVMARSGFNRIDEDGHCASHWGGILLVTSGSESWIIIIG